MGRTRTPEQPPTQEQAPPEPYAEEAAVIAAILTGSLVVPNPLTAIAAILLAAAPAAFLALPAVAASTAHGIASLLVQPAQGRAGRGQPLTPEQLGREAVFKGFYAFRALGRVVAAEDKLKALRRESRFFQQQLDASRRRVAGERLNQAAAEIHGPILGWVHTGRAKTHRPEHARAHGKNFDIRKTPVSTGGLPAMLPFCDCVPGPPFPGAPMLD